MKVLLEPEMCPKGRMITMTRENLWVLSECCQGPIRDAYWTNWTDKSGKFMQGEWMQCTSCMAELEPNPRGYTTKLELEKYRGMNGVNWAPWGKYMTGYDDFAMEIE